MERCVGFFDFSVISEELEWGWPSLLAKNIRTYKSAGSLFAKRVGGSNSGVLPQGVPCVLPFMRIVRECRNNVLPARRLTDTAHSEI